jgi:hypothetical protein
MRHNLTLSALALAMTAFAVPSRTSAQTQRTPAAHCSSPEYRQFDFFAGDWDTYDITDSTKIVARNHVSRMLDGCAIREVYQQSDGMSGESFSVYDASRKVWHQSWVTNRGTLLLMDGGLQGADMAFTGTTREKDGSTSHFRVKWIPQRGSVREIAENSSDDGKTWKPMFDIVFRLHK